MLYNVKFSGNPYDMNNLFVRFIINDSLYYMVLYPVRVLKGQFECCCCCYRLLPFHVFDLCFINGFGLSKSTFKNLSKILGHGFWHP